MKITDAQHTLLETLKCERLSSRQENRDCIRSFENERNVGLAVSLKQDAWQEDEEGHIAYYLIKDKEGEVLFYFSLKCGALFQHLNEEELVQAQKVWDVLRELLTNTDEDSEDAQIANIIIEKFRSKKSLSNDDINELIKRIPERLEILDLLKEEKENERNRHIVQVNHTYSGIELVHFCKNDAVKDKWKDYNIPHPLGKVIFWKFIVPIIGRVKEGVGCQYAFLFAADWSPDESLVNYYNTTLHFEQPEEIGTNKPLYDFSCRFMCQEVNKLFDFRADFFENFNPEGELV